jgi:hypothetical protein
MAMVDIPVMEAMVEDSIINPVYTILNLNLNHKTTTIVLWFYFCKTGAFHFPAVHIQVPLALGQ